MERKISSHNLKFGMFVSNLDRPWLDTPFPMQGFTVQDENDINSLKEYCHHLYIDTEKGVPADTYLDHQIEQNKHYIDDFLSQGKRRVVYEEHNTVFNEYPTAEHALESATLTVANIMDNVKAGDNLDVQKVREAIQPMLDSMIRNSDALLWMLKVQQDNSPLYTRARDNCALGIAFGRHLGMYKEDLRLLAMGMLLLDVGTTKISPDIMNKKGALTRAEFSVMQKHVEYGVEILKNTPGIDDAIINMVLTHHERLDGSGYPQGLEKTQIPIFGRIAAIIDVYNAMTTKTSSRDAIAQHTVLQELYRWRNKYFQHDLVEQFLQCVGVYPTGSLVEMTSGEVGIVIAQNRKARLKPTLMMLLDEQKQPYEVHTILDLASDPEDASGLELKILHALKPGAYGIESENQSV